MLRSLVLIFSIASFILILHFSSTSSGASRANIVNPAQNWRLLNNYGDAENPQEDEVHMIITTSLPIQIARNRQFSIDFLRDYYGKQAQNRVIQLRTINAQTKFATLYNVLVPEVYCPHLVRVGNVNDGGKWVCNPKALPKENCSIYSLGLRDDISFDREIQEFNSYGCQIYGYDAVQQQANTINAYTQINGKAQKIKIAPKTNLTMAESSIEDLLRSNGDNYTEILKMDIEGAEYTTLPKFLDQYHPCQIYLEMHGESLQMRNLLYQISRRGYYLYFYEINGDSLKACEYSFIHEDCMDRYGVFMLAPYLKSMFPETSSTPTSPIRLSPSANMVVFSGKPLNGPSHRLI